MLFRRGYNFEFPWVLINFRGCCISCIFKIKIVIMETTHISSVIRISLTIRISSAYSHHEIQLLGQFLYVQ